MYFPYRKIFMFMVVFTALMLGGVHLFVNYLSVYSLNQTGIEGKVKKLDYGWWGIESTSIVKRKILAKNLPKQFQKDGLAIKCNVVVLDRLSVEDWQIITEVNNCAGI